MRHNLLIIVAVAMLAACRSGPTPILTSHSPLATVTPPATRTSLPSATPSPNATPTPSATPRPSATATATPVLEPLLAGTFGNGVISGVYRSPDGKFIVLGDVDGVRLFDAATLEDLGLIGVAAPVADVMFSDDGALAAVQNYFSFDVVDLASRTVVAEVRDVSNCGIGAPAFSRDRRYVAYLNVDRSTGGPYHSIGLWNVTENRLEWRFPSYNEQQYHVLSPPAISPDGTWVAAGHSDKRVYVWNTSDGEIRFALEGHASLARAVAVSPNGQLLASGGSDGTVRLWNPLTGQLIRTLIGFLNDITALKFSSNSQLEVGVAEAAPQVVDVNTGRLEPLVNPPSTPDPLAMILHQEGYADAAHDGANLAVFSPDGQRLALGSIAVSLWDPDTRVVMDVLETASDGTVRGLAYSGDGQRLAVLNDGGQATVWDIAANTSYSFSVDLPPGVTVFYFRSGAPISGIGPAIGAGVVAPAGIAFSPDGAHLAVTDGAGIAIWDVAEKRQAARLEITAPGTYATNLSFSEDGRRLYAVLNWNRAAQIWDLEPNALARQLDLPPVDPTVFTAVALHGPLFARNNSDGDESWVELWDLDTEQVYRLPTPSHETDPLRFSPDGRLLVGLSEGRLHFWKAETGELVYVAKYDAGRAGLAISPDGTRLAVAREGQVSLLDIGTLASYTQDPGFVPGPIPPTSTPYFAPFPTDPPQPTIAVTAIATPALGAEAISPENAEQVVQLARTQRGTVERILWSDAGEHITLIGSQGVYGYSTALTSTGYLEELTRVTDAALSAGRMAGVRDGHVVVWDTVTDQELLNLAGGGQPALSPDGARVVYSGLNGTLQVADVDSKKVTPLLYNWFGHSQPVFSPDGRLVAAIQEDDSVRVWYAETGAIATALGGPDNPITDLSFSPDGRSVVGAGGGTAWVWGLQPGARPERFDFYTSTVEGNLTLYDNKVTAAALSPSGQIVAVGTTEHTITLLNRNNHTLLRVLTGHAATIRELSYSPDGQRLLSVDQDGHVKLWLTRTGELAAMLDDHAGVISGLVFQLDGNVAAWGENTAWMIDPPSGGVVRTTTVPTGTILAASPAADWLAVYNPIHMEMWDARTGQFARFLEGDAEVVFVEHYDEGDIFQQFYGAAFSPDGNWLTAAGAGGVWIHNLAQPSGPRHEPGYVARKVAYSPDSGWLVTCMNDQFCQPEVFDLAANEWMIGFFEPRGEFLNFAVSPDRRWAAATVYALQESAILFVLVDTSTGLAARQLALADGDLYASVAFSPDSRLIAAGRVDGGIDLLNVATLHVVANLRRHNGDVNTLAFSADGLYLASAGADGTVRIWGLP